jgi:hypothetical protein
MAYQKCTRFELDAECVGALVRLFDRHAAEREARTVIGRAIAERERAKVQS